MIHLMIDLETLGNSARALFTEIGWAAFDEEKVLESGRIPVDVHLAYQEGRALEPEAVLFWLGRKPTFTGQGLDLRGALTELGTVIQRIKPERVWARSPQFDLAILADAYRQYWRETPWAFRNERDVRTLLEVAGTEPQKTGGHSAEGDARSQAGDVIKAWAALRAPR